MEKGPTATKGGEAQERIYTAPKVSVTHGDAGRREPFKGTRLA